MTNEECKQALTRIAGYMCARKDIEALTHAMNVLEQEPRKITLEDVKGYCKPRCLTIISNELLYELTHPKIKAPEKEPFINKPCVSSGVCEHDKNKVLDKIRAEIEHIGGDDEKAFCKNLNESYKQGLKDAPKVIDKYKAESEG